jgi:ABC-2 type transport system permease protein
MRRFLAIFRKEFRQIRRDPLSLGLLVFIPAMLLALYGYALSFDVHHIRVAVIDRDRTAASRAFLDSLFQNPYFDRAGQRERTADADRLLDRGLARAVLVVPSGFAAGLERGATVSVQALVDGTDATTASTAVGYLDALAAAASRPSPSAAPQAAAEVVPEPRIWFNPEMQSARFLIPGLIALLLMLASVVATSLSIVREKERETMEQLMVSPLRPEELILGKTLPYVAIGLATMILVLLLSRLLFGVAVRGSLPLLALATLLFLFSALGLGVLISASTRSQQVAFQIAVIASLLPSIILSGFIFPIRNMPLPIQAVTTVMPPRYFVSALRKIVLKDAPFADVWVDLAAMLALGAVFNLLAALKTRKAV